MNLYRNTKLLLIGLLVTIFLLGISLNGYVAEEKITIRLGHHHNVGGVVDKMCNKFKTLAEDMSNSKLEILVCPGAQLGQEIEASQGVLIGTLQMTAVCSTTYKDKVDGFGIDALPFLFKDRDAQLKIFNSSIGKKLEEKLIKAGARILGWQVYGSRHLIFAKKNVNTFDEMQGLKMRSPEAEAFIEMFKRMGTIPTPITWGEAYTALQTGVVDGMDTPIINIKDMHFYEVSKYCLLTNHMLGTMNILINENFYQGLHSDIQEIILDAGKKAIDYGNQLVSEGEETVIDWLKEEGMVFNVPAEKEMEKFKEAIIPMQDTWAEQYNCTDLLKEIRSVQ